MRFTQKEKFVDFLKSNFYKYKSHPSTYIYGIISMIGLGLYWYDDGIISMLKVLFLLTTALSFTFLLCEIYVILTIKEVEENKLIWVVSVFVLLSVITKIFFDISIIKQSIYLGFILFIPIIILSIITKLKNYF